MVRLLRGSFIHYVLIAVTGVALVISLSVAWFSAMTVLFPPRGQRWPMGGTSPKARAVTALAGLCSREADQDAGTPMSADFLFIILGLVASDWAGQLPMARVLHCIPMSVVLTRDFLQRHRNTVARLSALDGGGAD